MEFDWQYIVVGVLFVGAIFYVYKSIKRNSKGEAGCAKCDAHPEPGKKGDQ
ncbi:MAG: FeoB-associated Cys-rich membrane protein [Bacteroidota bacterium]|nr:FeoB-associated Cys-rich membrane protein [Bacteroidota bacterium]